MPIRRPTLPRFSGQICCPERLYPFVNQLTSDVPYVGDEPLINVLYYLDGVFVAVGVNTQITIAAGNIHVDHGGPATGIIKISV